MNSKIFVFEAIDGAGKDTLARTILDTLAQGGRRVFDAIEFQKEYGQLPLPDHPDVLKAEFLLVCEPSYVTHRGASYRLRDHIVPGSQTSQRTLVKMYGEDRLALYEQLVIPFLKTGGTVIQVRGLSSSLAYQPAVDPSITLDEIMSEPGNQLELRYAPKALLVLSISNKEAERRRKARGPKEDPSIFDAEAVQDACRTNYHSQELRKIFTDQGTRIIDIGVQGSKQENFERVFTALAPYLG
ncbi:MAG: hypothetical protein KC582_02355 [Candidatus Magasanikbacteria bacterium]|nr:hypothetical protein [Candidatus Magasanikbacteria bacterium]MCA9391072.1 hypothetical protein [Candidatus Magasanikbacteria bacterium]USN52565.1 MAG: hypothetical protein H6759_00580 [Candidatus Nomurabacteria bacterium]